MICPEIKRQRLIVEGIYGLPLISEETVNEVLGGLTRHLEMTPIADTLIFSPDAVSKLHHGIGGYQAWAESGCSFYTWREKRLFTLDIYTCKGFKACDCITFLRKALQIEMLSWREV
ncbi:MAG: S-adenosylmethionine decarboxylase [Candidatus Thiodiazotropha sp. (ex Lucinoma annulata)]|nr:S-adenosylmethionine decarboxylase [Candidatus Thiodiazotropha sp. (ex Lucinoma annulata)]